MVISGGVNDDVQLALVRVRCIAACAGAGGASVIPPQRSPVVECLLRNIRLSAAEYRRAALLEPVGPDALPIQALAESFSSSRSFRVHGFLSSAHRR